MWRALLTFVVVVILVVPSWAESRDDDRVQFGRAMVVQQGQTINGDAVCIACAIVNHGNITGDAVVIMGSLKNDGAVGGDTVVVMGTLQNGGSVDGDANVVAGSLNVSPGGVIAKNASVVMGGTNIAPGATIGGKLERSLGGGAAVALLFFVPLVVGLVFAIVLALICYSVAGQQRIAVIAGVCQQKPGLTFVAGIIAIVVFVFALWAFAHMRPLSGFLVIAACIAFAVMMIVGYTGLSYAIGYRLRSASPVSAVVIGAIVIAVAQAIPLVQVFLGFVLAMFALGAAALTGFGTHPEWMETRMGRPAAPVR